MHVVISFPIGKECNFYFKTKILKREKEDEEKHYFVEAAI